MNECQTNIEDDKTNDLKSGELDTILVNEIGQFGKFQLKNLLLVTIIAVFGSWSAEYLFTAARINTRCLIPECDGQDPEWQPHWLSNAVPATSDSGFDNCYRFGNTSVLPSIDADVCPSTLFDQSTLQPCQDYVYENTHSVVYDFGLACDEWRRSAIGTIRTFGTLTALPITGFISDHWGRRAALVFNAFNTGWLGLTRYWTNTYIGFVISQVVEATFGAGGFSCIYILLMELVGPKYRVAAGAAISTSFSVGQAIMGVIAWAVPNWRHFTLVLYAPQLITILYFWLIDESVRWYMSKGRFEKSEALLRKVARINGKSLSEKSLKNLRLNTERIEASSDESWLIVQVFRNKKILLRCIISPIWWITMTFIYYGLTINAVNLSGNVYINFIAVSLVEVPGFWTSYLLMDRIGRKPVLIGAYWICAACQITYIFLPDDMYTVSLTVFLIGKYVISMTTTSLYVYTAELYPTRHRHSLFAFSSMIGRIGSIIAPLTPAIGVQWFEELPYILFACIAFISGATMFLTPETLGTNLPDTFDQAAHIGSKVDDSKNI